MQYQEISFQGFHGRDEELKKIIRYTLYDTMFYRTNLLVHSKRVLWLLESILPLAKQVFPNLDIERARTLALVHDDAEIITGDIQLGNKLNMTKEQLQEIHDNEEKAIYELAKKFPKKINSFSYKELLLEILNKESIESQLITLVDKFDAFGEALHEIFEGNKRFAKGKQNIIPPTIVYTKILTEFPEKFPKLKALFSFNHPMLNPPEEYHYEEIVERAKPHTEQTVKQKTGHEQYDFWKKLTLERGNLSLLIERKE